MQGTSGTYSVNGTDFTAQPEYGNWDKRDSLGLDGNGRNVYPVLRSFEITWGLLTVPELQQVVNFQLASETGTVVVDLPQWGASTYSFYSYSGTVMEEVGVGRYFVEYVEDVTLKINNIRTN